MNAALPPPRAWHVNPGHPPVTTRCEAGDCKLPVAVVTWRWFRSGAPRRVIVSERFVCLGHGVRFAERHRIVLQDWPEGGTS